MREGERGRGGFYIIAATLNKTRRSNAGGKNACGPRTGRGDLAATQN